MIGKWCNSRLRANSMDTPLQTSVYGASIPNIYGRSSSPLSVIWIGNIRDEGEGGKLKGKGDGARYFCNIDFMIGANPIIDPLNVWRNREDRFSLNFISYEVGVANLGSPTIAFGDPDFYALIGVTFLCAYDAHFDDYGSSAPLDDTGSFAHPMWNLATAGPGLDAGYRNWPFCYYWQPGSPTMEIPAIALGALSAYSPDPNYLVFTVYYAQVATMDGWGKHTPIGFSSLAFERELGSGSEYASDPDEQVLYPPYAGLGSDYCDLGTERMVKSYRVDILGSYPLYPEGDCDFADIIEDIFRSGMAQAAYGLETAFTQLQRGLGCYEYPGPLQKKAWKAADASKLTTICYDLGNTHENILIAVASAVDGWSATPSISDAAGNSWIPVLSVAGQQIWYCVPCNGSVPGNEVTLNIAGSDGDVQLLELGGLHEFDTSVIYAGPVAGESRISASITTGNGAWLPDYILSVLIDTTNSPDDWAPVPPLKPAAGKLYAQRSDYCIVRNPGTYTFSYDYRGEGGIVPEGTQLTWVLIAFKAIYGADYAYPIGDILDIETLDLCRQQCRAYSLWGSLNMDAQKKASDWLEDLYTCMNAAPVWSGFKLKSIPRSEISAVGNGGVYESPTAGGPIAHLGDNDFMAEPGDPVITVKRKSRSDSMNMVQLQYYDRDGDYNSVTISSPERSSITTFGLRKESPKMLLSLRDGDAATRLLGIMQRQQTQILNTYEFKLKANWKLLEPMDLVTITDLHAGIDHIPVRLTSVEEDENFNLQCEAEPYIYGLYAPTLT